MDVLASLTCVVPGAWYTTACLAQTIRHSPILGLVIYISGTDPALLNPTAPESFHLAETDICCQLWIPWMKETGPKTRTLALSHWCNQRFPHFPAVLPGPRMGSVRSAVIWICKRPCPTWKWYAGTSMGSWSQMSAIGLSHDDASTSVALARTCI